uniref:Peptidase T n=1 Tax=uncultured Elusimicrobia bacterium TaxID=699876 RepID=A0A650EM32_9BACT|nr:peptidase T [uncultured Elusimicrobia bacterium]
MNPLQQKIYDRFVRYAAVETTSDPASKSVPSTPSQISFAHMLASEMKTVGFQEVEVDEFGIVTGLLPANTDKKAPVIGFLAHMDTVCDYNGKDVRPVLHPNYDGGTLTINAEKNMFLSPETAPNLKLCIGDDIVTADGHTLLGGDDKIGIAVIMTLAEYLTAHPEIEHGPLKAAFTIDEEIGSGIGYFDVERFGADFAYTIDGANLGEVDCGNFNADTVTVRITGKSCHPGSAKGFMANPVRIAADIVSSWPEDKLPETTDGEDGFVLFKDIEGGLESATVRGIVREHDLAKFENFKVMLQELAAEKRKKYPAAKIEVEFKEQYRNMRDILKERPQAMELLEAALKENKVEYRLTQARGGTDGSQLSLRGLPTPNLFAGYENPHGPYEWMSMNWVEKAFHVLESIAKNAVK